MARSTGTRLGPYQITAPLGAGGMGEVYRALDTRLDRTVAIKVLKAHIAADPDVRGRFEREARAISALDHPNICALYDVGEQDGTAYLVMQYLEGDTLAQRIGGSPEKEREGFSRAKGLPVTEALALARQIADALEAAHERGIVHRDLKPANVMVLRDGTAKVLDFGLAKAGGAGQAGSAGDAGPAVAQGFSPADLTHSPTAMGPTVDGVLLGTAPYMSPEQARGKTVDKRTDIWAFGCVLYEMLTGRRAFGGETGSDTIAAILEREPNWDLLPEAVPARIRGLLHRCLRKDLKRRLHDIADARIEIDEALSEPPSSEQAVGPVAARGRERLVWMLTTSVLAVALAVAGAGYLRAPADAPEIRLDIATPATSDPVSFALSPDGRSIVFAASGDGPPRLWLRSLDSTSARPLAGTEGASGPFWSPDGRSVGFFGTQKLKQIDLVGGLPQALADVAPGVGATWGPDGVILFSPTFSSAIYRVPASGGDAVALTTLDRGQTGHSSPQFLPGGRQFLFFAAGTSEARGIYVGSLDAQKPTRVMPAESAGAYVAPGWLLFVRQTTLVARRFDPARGALSGDPVTVASPIIASANGLASALSTAASGLVAYRVEGTARRQLTWFDRSGKAVGTIGAADDQNLVDPELSPDGRQVAVNRTVEHNTDIWLVDAARTTRFTSDPGTDQFPIWSPDGTRIGFSSTRSGVSDLYQKSSSGAGTEEVVLASPQGKVLNDWSPDGRVLLFHAPGPKAGPDIWRLALDGDRKASVFLNSSAAEVWGQFSPDGRWVAYQTFETGQSEIAVQPFPGPGGHWTVSTSGGNYPRWGPDGRELFYVEPSGKLMAVPIRANGTSLDVGTPTALFLPPMVGGGTNVVRHRAQYDVAPDGRFLINVTLQEAVVSPITIVLNWKPKP